MTPTQCRAARALLNWAQAQLADVSTVSEATIRNFESGRITSQCPEVGVVERAFEAAGVIFVEGQSTKSRASVRLAKL
jgi:transcriptional regulator with XRE-family HTH domain